MSGLSIQRLNIKAFVKESFTVSLCVTNIGLFKYLLLEILKTFDLSSLNYVEGGKNFYWY